MRSLRVLLAAIPALSLSVAACDEDTTVTPFDGGADAAAADSATDAGRDAAQSDGASEAGTHDAASPDASSDAATDVDAGPMAITLQFKAKVGAQDFHCGTTYAGQGATGEPVEPADLRMFVQDVRLITTGGTEVPVTLDVRSPWQTADVALLDFEDGTAACNNGNSELNTTVTGTVPPGTYVGVAFKNGVPASLNHSDPTSAPAPLQAGGMTWGWLYGYKFVKLEVTSTQAPAADAGKGIGLIHLGSTGCDNSVDGGPPDFNQGPTTSCTNPNRNDIRLLGFSLATSKIVFDVGAVFGATDLSKVSQCHSAGAACPSMFSSLGVSFTTGEKLASQSAYRLE